MKRTVRQFVVACSTLAVLGTTVSTEWALAAAKPNGSGGSVSRSISLSGVVLDSSGIPQIGIVVDLLRADSSLAARVYTDNRGVYSIASVIPGQYAVKAAGSNFIPTLKQNLRIHANTIVNLTLNSIYDLMQWVPQTRRAGSQNQDDWAWTLRSAQSRPLLRWQDDGTPILVSDGGAETRRGSSSKRRLRAVATAGNKSFGSGPELVSVAMQEDTSARRRVAMSADVDPERGGLIDAMLGFRQEMTNSGLGSSSVQSLGAVAADPDAGAGGRAGLQTVSLRTWESIQILDGFEAEAGSNQVLTRVGDGSQVFAALPFAGVTMHHGQSSLEYRVATARTADSGASESMPGAWLPILSGRAGELVLEHGLHQELGWSTSAGPTEMQLIIYGDSVENPMLEGSGRLTPKDPAAQWMLVDRASGLIRAAGPNYSTAGVLASVESRLPGHSRVKLSYASGDALVMQATGRPEDIATILHGVHTRHAQMYSLTLSGTSEMTGTRWRASYRWQPESTVTQVAPFAVDASEPYLNVYVRQPIWANRQGGGTVEAQIDLRNLLAEGYQPFVSSDGSHLYFAQAQRCVTGGLAFNF